MKANLAYLSLAVWVFASCDKSGEKANSGDPPSKKPRMENQADCPTTPEKPAPARRDGPDANNRSMIDAPLSHPITAEMIKPAGTAANDGSWDALTIEKKIEKFNSSGIARLPKDVSDKILMDTNSAPNPEGQLHFITQQAAAWHHINEFKESINDIPEHMKVALLQRLAKNHGDSWKDMVTELDEQVAASARVMELRMKGIPGMSPDESQDLIINALEKYGSDYKSVLSIADKNAKK